MSENNAVRLPEVIVFAGPNGSGKSTITQMAKVGGEYINADDIKRTTLCTDLEAAVKAEELREYMIENREDFTFDAVRYWSVTQWQRGTGPCVPRPKNRMSTMKKGKY